MKETAKKRMYDVMLINGSARQLGTLITISSRKVLPQSVKLSVDEENTISNRV